MGLFDKLSRRKADTPMTVPEAIGAVLYLTIAADGEIADKEKDLFIGTSNRMMALCDQSAEEFNAMIQKIKTLHDAYGFDDTLAKAAGIIPAELRQPVFAYAADLVFADGSVEESEKAFLEAVQIALQVDDDFALKVLEVLEVKARG